MTADEKLIDIIATALEDAGTCSCPTDTALDVATALRAAGWTPPVAVGEPASGVQQAGDVRRFSWAGRVIPDEGSPEWEQAMARGMDASYRAVGACGLNSEQYLKLRLTYALAAAIRALPAPEVTPLAALRAAGWLVIPPLDTEEGKEAVERACSAYFDGEGYQWDESTGAKAIRAGMAEALRAAGGSHE